MKTLAIAVFASVILVGCGTTEPIINTQIITVTPPSSLMVNVPVVPPPDKKIYLSLTEWSDKEKMLVDVYNQQTSNIGQCNIQLNKLSEWKALQDKSNTEVTK